jgi:hypothetical protein
MRKMREFTHSSTRGQKGMNLYNRETPVAIRAANLMSQMVRNTRAP